MRTTEEKYGMGRNFFNEPTRNMTPIEKPEVQTQSLWTPEVTESRGMTLATQTPSFDYGKQKQPALTLNTPTPKETNNWNYGGSDAMAAGNSVVQGMNSGSFSGMGAGIGGAIGTVGGPAGMAIGSGIGAVGGGIIDYFLAEEAKREAEKKARKEEKEKKRWQKYQLGLEKRGRNLEDEQLQYGRDDAAMQRMLSAQGEMLKTKNAILQSGNLYRARKGRNWYGPQGITGQVRGGAIPKGTTANNLGYEGTTAEQTKISKPMGMGY